YLIAFTILKESSSIICFSTYTFCTCTPIIKLHLLFIISLYFVLVCCVMIHKHTIFLTSIQVEHFYCFIIKVYKILSIFLFVFYFVLRNIVCFILCIC